MSTSDNNDNERDESREIPPTPQPHYVPPKSETPTGEPANGIGTTDEGFSEREWNSTWSELPPTPPSDFDVEQIEEEFGDEGSGEGEMGFFDHLEELRWRIIKSIIALGITSIICGVFLNFLMNSVLLGPALRANVKLQNIEMMGQITLAIQVCLFSGLILAVPFILWQFWGFIKPGLYENERKNVGAIASGTILCFLVGVAFAYFVMIPTSIGFTANVSFGPIENRFSVSSYFSFVLGFILACGVVFEMPMLSYALSRFGVITPQFLRKYWRHALVVILIAAAIITPTPDPFNQLLLAAPLYGLYELSIIVSRFASKKRAEAAIDDDDEMNRLRA
jgi:sec-independent protein translocase protein TatC